MHHSRLTRNAVFTTLTFARDTDIRNTWLICNVTTNRYVQRVRRTVDSCDYLKVYEIHKDSYPHVHILFLFKHLNYNYNNTRWLPHDVYQKLKSSWTHGLSDHQSPIARTDYSALSYILKYVSKTSSTKHLWQLLLANTTENYEPELNENGYPIKQAPYAAYHVLLIPDTRRLDRTDIRYKRIKLVTWSRGFIQTYLNTIKHIKPCPNAP